MGRLATNILFVIGMAGVIVAVDVLLFRHHFWERLAVNFGIALVFVAFYFRFVHRG
jgi:cytochrome c oxidase subunit IV